MQLKDKVVLITGSSSGIGEATAILFARLGAKVVINYKDNEQRAKNVHAVIKKIGGTAIVVQADVSQPKDVDKLFSQTLKEFKTVDILINNAGVARNRDFLNGTLQEWHQDFSDNFYSAVLCSQAAAKIMLKQKSGKILNTASIRGLENTGRPGIMAYSAAKAALINFTKTLAKELAPVITVNAVAPGFTKTPPFDSVPQKVKDKFIEGTALKKWITPEEIAHAFLYLATSDSVTGEILVVDAGYSLKFD